MSLKIVLGSCLLVEASANFVSPGLGKCLDLEAELKGDGNRETLAEMEQDPQTSVQLYTCHGDHNQRYEFVGGQFRSWNMKAGEDRQNSFCLTASKIEDNADVHLELCQDSNERRQQWDLTGDGNVKVTGSDKCLDVKAALKEDGTREAWHEIKEHRVVNVHLYKCHDPETTERVNQLWGWAPWKNGKLLNAEIVQPATASAYAIGSDAEIVQPATASAYAIGSACPRPAGWCHVNDAYTDNEDCDGDGIADPVCIGYDGFGYLGSASGCVDNYPSDIQTESACLKTVGGSHSIASKFSIEHVSLGVARGVVIPGLCAVSFAVAVVAGAVLGFQRWRQASSLSSQLIPSEE